MNLEKLRALFASGGVSVLVATVDANGIPSCSRGVAARPADDFESMTVYLPVATAHETLANVATTHRIAVSCTLPISHSSIQLKGLSRGVRMAHESERPFVREQLESFAAALDDIGLPRRITRSMSHWPAFAIDLSIEEVFDQTPGPKAGNPFK